MTRRRVGAEEQDRGREWVMTKALEEERCLQDKTERGLRARDLVLVRQASLSQPPPHTNTMRARLSHSLPP